LDGAPYHKHDDGLASLILHPRRKGISIDSVS
jgi:hypothetical protein